MQMLCCNDVQNISCCFADKTIKPYFTLFHGHNFDLISYNPSCPVFVQYNQTNSVIRYESKNHI